MSSRKPYAQYTAADWLNDPDFDVTPARDEPPKAANAQEPLPDSGIVDAGSIVMPPPRSWLLGNAFCRKSLSALLGAGAAGKTSVRIAQYLSLASGRQLTGEYVFCRCRILLVCLEDDMQELSRRVLAAMMHYGIAREDIAGWLFLWSPGDKVGKLAADGRNGVETGTLRDFLAAEIGARKVDLLAIDPFKKAHGVDENDNTGIDIVVTMLTRLAIEHDIAVDVLHHVSKGAASPGDADKGRGASAMKDGGRLVYTLAQMSAEEAERLGVPEKDRTGYVRLDSGKVNLTPGGDARWFHLTGKSLDNGDETYPSGDNIQVAVAWTPPDAWKDLSHHLLNRILDDIDAGLPDGNRYTNGPNAGDREAWRVVCQHAPDKSEGNGREIIKTWVRNGVLIRYDCKNTVTRNTVKGLKVDAAKRPT